MFLNLAKEIVVKVGAERKCSKTIRLTTNKMGQCGLDFKAMPCFGTALR